MQIKLQFSLTKPALIQDWVSLYLFIYPPPVAFFFSPFSSSLPFSPPRRLPPSPPGRPERSPEGWSVPGGAGRSRTTLPGPCQSDYLRSGGAPADGGPARTRRTEREQSDYAARGCGWHRAVPLRGWVFNSRVNDRASMR